jgi:transposase InsO family protein
MPWKVSSVIEQRRELVELAGKGHLPFRALCRRFGISPRTGYKWQARYRRQGPQGLADRSRRPHRTRPELPAALQQEIVALRRDNPAWGARTLRRWLQDRGWDPVPAASSITAVLHRHGLIGPEAPPGQRPWQRFEHPAPNALWQMDFKAPVPTLQGRVHPLTLLDDHSRFCLCLRVLSNQQQAGVKQALVDTFGCYGLPDAILVDNGGPWGDDDEHRHTQLTVWLLHVGVAVRHSRPYHPQTLGKEERFHGTLQRELLGRRQWRGVLQLQGACDPWRHRYNFERPHQALGLAVPGSRYQPSLRAFPETLPAIEYPGGVAVRRVDVNGHFCFQGRRLAAGRAFAGYPIGLRPTARDGVFEIVFLHHVIRHIDLRRADAEPR